MSIAKIRFSFLIALLFICIACSSFTFIDDSSSFDAWYSIPNNAKYLKLKVYSHKYLSEIKGRCYYLTLMGCNAPMMSIVEVAEHDGIMNIFPLPAHSDSIDITYGNFFPGPSVIGEGVRIISNIDNRVGTYTFEYYSISHAFRPTIYIGSKLICKKKLVIDFSTKIGTLYDYSEELEAKIWF